LPPNASAIFPRSTGSSHYYAASKYRRKSSTRGCLRRKVSLLSRRGRVSGAHERHRRSKWKGRELNTSPASPA
jgi:hypothetical protein